MDIGIAVFVWFLLTYLVTFYNGNHNTNPYLGTPSRLVGEQLGLYDCRGLCRYCRPPTGVVAGEESRLTDKGTGYLLA